MSPTEQLDQDRVSETSCEYAYHPPKELAKLLRSSEKHATRRLVAAAAFVVLANNNAGKPAAIEELERLAKEAGPFGRGAARLALGLIASSANGVQFLARLTP